MALELDKEAWSDFEILIDKYLDATEPILQKDKYIIPMATVMKGNKPSFVALQPENDKTNSDTKTHIKAYRKLLRELSDNRQACILGYDIKIKHEDYNDAIAIELEHANGTHQKMFVPYKFTGLRKNKLRLGQSKLIDPESERILSN
jgi:hypothetical protein